MAIRIPNTSHVPTVGSVTAALNRVREFAKRTLLDYGQCSAMLHIVGTGKLDHIIMPGDYMQSGYGKEVFTLAMRKLFEVLPVCGYVFVSEVWFAHSPDPADQRLPSDRPDKLEALMLTTETVGGVPTLEMLEIKRDARGAIVGFAPVEIHSGLSDGRFADLLPKGKPQ